MRTKLIILGIVGMVLAPLMSWGDETPPKGPEAFLPQSVYESAPVVEGVDIQHDFILHNRGREALVLLKIDSD